MPSYEDQNTPPSEILEEVIELESDALDRSARVPELNESCSSYRYINHTLKKWFGWRQMCVVFLDTCGFSC